VALSFSPMLLPVLVTALLSATMNAYFYTASMVVTLFIAAPSALSTTLFAVGARRPTAIASPLRLTFGLSLLAALVANLLLWVAADPVMRLFGPAYAENATASLRIMAIGLFPFAVRDHFVAICRIRRQVPRALRVSVLGAALELLLAAIGAQLGGLSGLSLGWVVALTLEAIVMSPPVWQVATAFGSPALDELAHASPDLELPVAASAARGTTLVS
jgi:O-antigen/teichoic acid export membrane protein